MSEASLFPSNRDDGCNNRYPLGGCGNVKYDVNRRMFHGSVASNITDTSQRVTVEFAIVLFSRGIGTADKACGLSQTNWDETWNTREL